MTEDTLEHAIKGPKARMTRKISLSRDLVSEEAEEAGKGQ